MKTRNVLFLFIGVMHAINGPRSSPADPLARRMLSRCKPRSVSRNNRGRTVLTRVFKLDAMWEKKIKKRIFFLFKEAGAEARCAMNHFIIHEERRGKKSEADSSLRECLRGLNSEFPSAHQSAETNIDASLLLVIVRSGKLCNNFHRSRWMCEKIGEDECEETYKHGQSKCR